MRIFFLEDLQMIFRFYRFKNPCHNDTLNECHSNTGGMFKDHVYMQHPKISREWGGGEKSTI